jgi:hypothetical protein
MGKRIKPVLQERFIGYPVPSAPSPNMSARVRCGPGRKQIVGWPLGGQTLSQEAGQNRLTPPGATRSGYATLPPSEGLPREQTVKVAV